MRQDLEMIAGGWLAHAQFLCDENAAHSVSFIAVHLGRKVFLRVLEPFQDLQPALAGKRPKCGFHLHASIIASLHARHNT